MEHISPELVLVDPELARIARACLPERRDSLADLTRSPLPAPSPPAPARRRARPSLLIALGAAIVAALIGVPRTLAAPASGATATGASAVPVTEAAAPVSSPTQAGGSSTTVAGD